VPADVIMQAVSPAEVHLQIRQLGDMVDGVDELASFGLERIHAEFVVHQQTEPEPETADFDGLLLDVHSKETVLDEMLLGMSLPSVALALHRVFVPMNPVTTARKKLSHRRRHLQRRGVLAPARNDSLLEREVSPARRPGNTRFPRADERRAALGV